MSNSGDIAWVLISTILVTMMTPALAFFYGGMVRRKNILSTLNLSFIAMAIVSVQWVLFGYSLSFSKDVAGVIGNLDKIGLIGASLTSNDAIPEMLIAAFQGTFAMITVAIISGSVVERVSFKAFILFALAWTTLVYDPIAHWVWGNNGFLAGLGVLDFAGGTVVHISSGIAALIFALHLRKRMGYSNNSIAPHNIPFTVLGAGLLWVGWLGFNGGSSLAADGIAIVAIVNTTAAAATSALVWMAISYISIGKPSTLGIVTGLVVGLVAITPAAGFVEPWAALIIGAIAPIFSYNTMLFMRKKGIDESLDVFACHGMAGIWGSLATGLFATTTINAAGSNGLFFGNPKQLVVQLFSVVVVIVYTVIVTTVILQIINRLFSLSVDKKRETIGLDLSDHRETGYNH